MTALFLFLFGICLPPDEKAHCIERAKTKLPDSCNLERENELIAPVLKRNIDLGK